MRKIILVRHGETQWSLSRRHTGRTDLPLTPAGEDQARGLREQLLPLACPNVWSSPLKRAFSTCEAAGLSENAHVFEDLMEWDYGVFDGRTTAEIVNERPGWNVWDATEGLGETVQEVGRRADTVISRILETDGDIMMFSHAHFLRILGARWVGLEAIYGRHWTLEPASISVLSYERQTPTIALWNWVPHGVVR
ncbi:MAG: histidine phosphatase family protein [bacterium]